MIVPVRDVLAVNVTSNPRRTLQVRIYIYIYFCSGCCDAGNLSSEKASAMRLADRGPSFESFV